MKRLGDRFALPSPVGLRLQEAWLRRLRWSFDLYNYLYLSNRLRAPLLRLSNSRTRVGEWDSARRMIAISQWHILEHPWEAVIDTLRHEMAHQYVDEVLRLPGAPPHGSHFIEACKLLRANPAVREDTATLGSLAASRDERDRLLQRIQEILALTSSPNENEAANAMRMANRYLLKYNIDVAELDRQRHYATRHLGRPLSRIQEYHSILSRILQDHFFVDVLWVFSYEALQDRPGRILQAHGTPENLEIAAYVHDYVTRLGEDLWEKYKRATPPWRSTKFQYLAGLLDGFERKLDRQKKELKEEHGLIWRCDPGLEEYARYMNPRVSRMGARGVQRTRGYADGFAQGQRITIRKGVPESARSRGRSLPGPGG